LVNNVIIRKSSDETKLGEINNISTTKTEIGKVKIVPRDVIDAKDPLFHDPEKLAKELINLYNEVKKKN